MLISRCIFMFCAASLTTHFVMVYISSLFQFCSSNLTHTHTHYCNSLPVSKNSAELILQDNAPYCIIIQVSVQLCLFIFIIINQRRAVQNMRNCLHLFMSFSLALNTSYVCIRHCYNVLRNIFPYVTAQWADSDSPRHVHYSMQKLTALLDNFNMK